MHKYYIPHELKVGDITHLADNDSEIAIKIGIKVEEIIEIETYTSIFNAIVTNISKRNIEVEILEKVGDRKGGSSKDIGGIAIIQSISNPKKFGFFLEKAVEIGINSVFPLSSELSIINGKEFLKNKGLYEKIITDATEQSRNPYPTILKSPCTVSELKDSVKDEDIKICLATESVKCKGLKEIILANDMKGRNVYIAIGPESGWSIEDIDGFKKLGFEFVELKGNILRTETVGLVIGSIVKFVRGEI